MVALHALYENPAVQIPKAAKTGTGKKDMETVADKILWMNTWSEYVHGHIVSKSVARLIQSFLLNTFASSSPKDDSESEV